MKRPIYISSYCNFAHYLDTGRPIGHECRIIPPKALQAEREDRISDAIEIMKRTREVIVKGRKVKE